MSGIGGLNIKLAIYGESHGKSIGLVLEGMPPGIELDLDKIMKEMARRAPGQNALSTPRKESDAFEIQSGFFNGRTTGTPLCAVIKNSDQHSKDYSILADKMRPGHADYAGFVHYQGCNDYRGGGQFSGRLTAPLVLAGAIAKQALAKYGIVIGSHILSVGDIKEKNYDPMGMDIATLAEVDSKAFPVMDDEIGKAMQEKILAAKAELNSVGGTIETIVMNMPAGIGAPYFDSVESCLSKNLFSVPAVKAVEFGDGFDITLLTGAEANDQLHYVDGKVTGYTNHNGGATGGISNGMPIIFRVGLKPTPSISREQRTVSIKDKADTTLTIVGRHDPCIVQRAVPVIEAVTAWTIWDLILEAKKWEK